MMQRFILFLTTMTLSLIAMQLMAKDCEITRHSTYVEVSKNKVCKTDSIELTIWNRSGEEYTNISIPYSKNERISDVDGWIEDMSCKKLRSLKKSALVDRNEFSDMSLYEDNFVKTFQLKNNTYPYKVCYTYKITQNQFITIANWSPVVHSGLSTKEAKLTVSIPTNCRTKQFLRDATFIKSDTTDQIVTTVYEAKFDAAEENESDEIPFEERIPRVVIVPENFNYGINGSTVNWKDFGNWFYYLNSGLNDLPLAERNTIAQLIKGISDKREVVRTLYHYLQDHTRYINISVGIGGFKAYPASYVAQNKYGDCKALTNFMKTMLEFAGIQSNFVLIYRSLHPEKIISDLPFSQFNHVLLAVPLNKDTIWIENTENTEAFNYVGSSIQNRKALLVEENQSRLISMPVMQKKEVILNRNIRARINEQGNAETNTTFNFHGYYYELFNELNSGYSKDEKERIIREYMPFANYEVVDWELHRPDRDTAKIELTAKLNLYKLLKNAGGEFYFSTFPIQTALFTPPSERKLPVRITMPVLNIDSVTYILPDIMEVKTMPKDLIISTRYGTFETHYSREASTLIVSKKFELFPIECSLEQYGEFYEFYSAVKEAEKRPIVLKKKTAKTQ